MKPIQELYNNISGILLYLNFFHRKIVTTINEGGARGWWEGRSTLTPFLLCWGWLGSLKCLNTSDQLVAQSLTKPIHQYWHSNSIKHVHHDWHSRHRIKHICNRSGLVLVVRQRYAETIWNLDLFTDLWFHNNTKSYHFNVELRLVTTVAL